jgi:hypothetical protein
MKKGDFALMPHSHGYRGELVEIVKVDGADAVVRMESNGEQHRIYLSLLGTSFLTKQRTMQARKAAADRIGRVAKR